MAAEETRWQQEILKEEAADFWAWRRLVTRSFVPLEVTSNRPQSFQGTMHSRTVDDVSIVAVTANSHNVFRKPSLICESDPGYYKVSVLLSGSALLLQENREAVLLPGDIAVYDTNRPYTLTFDSSFRSLVLMFPHSRIGLPASAVRQLTAVRMPGDAGLATIVSTFLVEISRNLDQLSGASGARLALNAVDLVATMLSAELDVSCVSTTGHTRVQLMARIRNYIEDNLHDPELSPASVASAHFISCRYLHKLFRDENETAAHWIRTRRLEQIRRELRDPVYAHRSISTIASQWGYHDAAHFSRIFRSAFGLTPSNYRYK